MAEMTIAEKQYLAKILFTKEKLDGKIIAKRVHVSENTISNWVNKFNWKSLRNRLLIGKDETLNNYYEQAEELNRVIKSKPEGQRYPDTKQADIQIKLTASIRNLKLI
ncbi:DDE transposase family protein [Niabella sp. W65]|nr:DDE transposase family protein [Niabella sp. W65]MCH7368533.1 DDE transposase family protein [Niabella sp. W65]ULT44124.1 DDE transposase family protein [Niabella sp. I65]